MRNNLAEGALLVGKIFAPKTSDVNTAEDGQEFTFKDNPRSTARDGEDEQVEDDGLHAYHLFHATPEQLQEVEARLHSHDHEEVKEQTIEIHQWEVSSAVHSPTSGHNSSYDLGPIGHRAGCDRNRHFAPYSGKALWGFH